MIGVDSKKWLSEEYEEWDLWRSKIDISRIELSKVFGAEENENACQIQYTVGYEPED